MANILTAGLAYDPYFYANEALAQLNKALGMAFYIHRDYDRTAQQKGSTIQVRRPGTFTAQSMPIATGSASDINPEYINVTLDQWKGTLFALTDKELTYTREQIVEEHIGPSAIAVADAIDQSLAALYKDVPWIQTDDATTPTNDFPAIRKLMFDNKVPTGMRSYMIDGVLQQRYEALAVFHQANTGVDAAMLQREGMLGRKFGFNIFANQNTPAHTAGAITCAAPITDGAITFGATSVVVDHATSLTGTVKAGDVISFAGHSQKYAVTADATAAGNSITISFTPGIQVATVGDGVAVTFAQVTSTTTALAFHRDAFTLAMAPLSSLGDGAGARIASVTDPLTGLTLRSRIFYDGGTAKNYVGIDALWGVKTLNPNMAVRLEI